MILLAAHFLICTQRIFRKPVTRAHTIIHTVDFLELCNSLERFIAKGNLAFKSMQSNSLEQVTKRYVEIFRKCFENLYNPLFHSHADLHTLYRDAAMCGGGVLFKAGYNVLPSILTY